MTKVDDGMMSQSQPTTREDKQVSDNTHLRR